MEKNFLKPLAFCLGLVSFSSAGVYAEQCSAPDLLTDDQVFDLFRGKNVKGIKLVDKEKKRTEIGNLLISHAGTLERWLNSGNFLEKAGKKPLLKLVSSILPGRRSPAEYLDLLLGKVNKLPVTILRKKNFEMETKRARNCSYNLKFKAQAFGGRVGYTEIIPFSVINAH